MVIRYHPILMLAVLVTSCRSAAPRTEPQPATRENSAPLPSSPEVSTRNSWLLQPTNNPHTYRSSTISSIAMDPLSVSLQDSTTLTTDFAISISRDTHGAFYSITVDGLSLKPASRASTYAVPNFLSPVSFAGRLEPGHISLNTPADCNNQVSSVLPTIQRALLLLPLQLQRGQTWTDSTSGAVCSGSVPVTLTALRQYRVVGETNKGILVERLDKTTSAGEGADGQHRVQLKSEGSGQTQLLVDPATGALLEATSTNTALVTITTSGRSQKFTQTSREHVTQR